MQTNIHSIINQTVRFLSFLFLLSLMTGCFLFFETEEEKQARKNRKVSSNIMMLIILSANSNECLERTNIDITEGQTLGPYTTLDQCFKVTISGNTSVQMITPGTTTGNLTVWSSDPIPEKRRVQYKDDPTITISGSGTWYAKLFCVTCSFFSIQIP